MRNPPETSDEPAVADGRLSGASDDRHQGVKMDTYKIVRHFQDSRHRRRTIDRGLSLAEAQAHCKDPETSHKGTGAAARRITRKYGAWFDGYEKE